MSFVRENVTPMEGKFMGSTKEARRPGLVEAALKGRITNRQGAEALQMSLRQFIRLRKRVRKQGTKGLFHRKRGRPSPRRLPEAMVRRVTEELRLQEVRLNDCYPADLLEEEGHAISPSAVRRWTANVAEGTHAPLVSRASRGSLRAVMEIRRGRNRYLIRPAAACISSMEKQGMVVVSATPSLPYHAQKAAAAALSGRSTMTT